MDIGDGIFVPWIVLQKLLCGVRTQKHFDSLRVALRTFVLLPVSRDTHVAATAISNACRSRGVAASPVDSLIASACAQTGYPLLSADEDFVRIARYCDPVVLPPRAAREPPTR